MEKINISKVILKNRKNRNITQEDLADYLSVSKASVSKWETGNSYPDILLLPKLANYFDISIDELLGYSSQLSFKEIRRLYDEFGKMYQNNKEETLKKVETKIKEYYSCYDFILSMSQWFLNYGILNEVKEEREKMIDRSYQLSYRVYQNSDKPFYKNLSETFLGYIHLYRKEYDEFFGVLGKEPVILTENMKNLLISKVYISLGNLEKAEEVVQVSIFQLLSELLNSLSIYQSIKLEDKEKCSEVYNQTIKLIEIFNFNKNGNNPIFFSNLLMAQSKIIEGDLDSSVMYLEKYYEIIKKIEFPVLVNRNEYFNLIDDWIERNLYLGNTTPISDNQLKKNLLNEVYNNPMFKVLEDNDNYKNLLKKLEGLKNEY